MSPRWTVEELSRHLGDKPLALVYVAGTRADAHAAERVLDDRQIDFAVSLETFTTESPFLFGGEYRGVFFYVTRDQHELARHVLETNGLKDTVDME